MNRQRLALIHRWSARAATALIGAFFVSSVVVELAGGLEAIRTVKQAIVWAIPALVVLLAGTGISGRLMTGASKAVLVEAKKRTTGVMAGLGVCVLIPSAVALHVMANSGHFGTGFWVVQGVEFVAGAANLALALVQMRRGSRLQPTRRAV